MGEPYHIRRALAHKFCAIARDAYDDLVLTEGKDCCDHCEEWFDDPRHGRCQRGCAGTAFAAADQFIEILKP